MPFRFTTLGIIRFCYFYGMKTATVVTLKKELKTLDKEALINISLRLSKFKKENKELLTYLLFESQNEEIYITEVKEEVATWFADMNTTSYFYIKKSVRKILRNLKKYIRYSGNKETEVALLLYFCKELKKLRPSIKNNATLENIYERQLAYCKTKITLLHEDLQHDYGQLVVEVQKT